MAAGLAAWLIAAGAVSEWVGAPGRGVRSSVSVRDFESEPVPLSAVFDRRSVCSRSGGRSRCGNGRCESGGSASARGVALNCLPASPVMGDTPGCTGDGAAKPVCCATFVK